MPEKRKFPKVLRRGCKRSFGPREQEASCIGAKWGCTGAKEGLGGAKDFWETFAPWAHKSQKDLLQPPLTTFRDFPYLGNFPGPQHPNPMRKHAQKHGFPKPFLQNDLESLKTLSEGVDWGMGWGGGRNGRFWGAPIFSKTPDNTAFPEGLRHTN